MHLADLEAALGQLETDGLLREPETTPLRDQLRSRFGSEFIDLSSNDYLGLRIPPPGGLPAGVGAGERGAELLAAREGATGWGGATGSPASSDHFPVSRETVELDRSRERSILKQVTPRMKQRPPGGSIQSVSGLGAKQPPGAGDAREGRRAESPAGLRPSVEAAGSPVSRETVPALGAGASRLIFGTDPSHLEVERLVADWLGQPAALLFSTGYAANVGALGCLLGPDDCVLSDALNHASLIDGIRLSRARPTVFPHLDLRALEAALERNSRAPARWVVLESYYSMDGDGPDLRQVRALCDRAGAHLYLDEAHGLGIFGPSGAGRAREAGVVPDVHMVAFGKATGSQGACVAGSEALRTYLWNRARSFVFSTAPSPLLCRSLAQQLVLTRSADDRRAALAETSREFRRRATEAGLTLPQDSFGPICSILVGAPEVAMSAATQVRDQGLLVQAIRPPTVPAGESRLRLTLHAGLEPAQIERAVSLLQLVLGGSPHQ